MAFKLLGKKETPDETIQEIKNSVELPSLEEDFKPSIKSKPVESKITEVYQVVDTLPVQEIRKGRREDGVIVNFITKEEAQEMINARNV